ncbi:MAG: flotillin family protein, partial [Bacteroidia bacterium]|nr:flotillin family protein [Bacteroidia bacterium]
MREAVLTAVIAISILSVTVVALFIARYKKCPADKIMVIYGKIPNAADGTYRSAMCIHGGAAFIVPIFQSYAFLDLTPISISVDLRNAVSKENIPMDVVSRFTVGISTEPGVMQNAAERLLGLASSDIEELAIDIIMGQLRLMIATMEAVEIDNNCIRFFESVNGNVESELKKIGIKIINTHILEVKYGEDALYEADNTAQIEIGQIVK